MINETTCAAFSLFMFSILCTSFHHTVMIELEISNRGFAQMREDFLIYFSDHPHLLGVVVIKLTGPPGNLCCFPLSIFHAQ